MRVEDVAMHRVTLWMGDEREGEGNDRSRLVFSAASDGPRDQAIPRGRPRPSPATKKKEAKKSKTHMGRVERVDKLEGVPRGGLKGRDLASSNGV